MRHVFRFLTRGWFLGLIGVIALCVVIWLGGPLVSIDTYTPLLSPISRAIACAAVFVLWLFNLLIRALLAKRSNTQLIDNLVATPIQEESAPTDMSAEEVAQLKERFEWALTRLKKSGVRNRFGRQALYDIPWYVIIGPPGTGKTTLINNSGLDFPLSDQTSDRKVQGIGGTRNCDWWFANEAILLDTAGRYVTQDSHAQADSGAWLGFLDLLKTSRPRRPLNGILIVASISDIQSDAEQHTDHHANAIRQRIQEIYDRLGVRLPIYLVVTKCDLIAGFTEFFDDLSAEQRNQVWGVTFPEKSGEESRGDPLPFFASEFDGLINRLNERLLRRMSQERDQSRRDRVYRFPQQVENIKPLVINFIQATFRSSQYDHPAWLRGVYLTSGTQEGSPIDRVMGGMARNFNLNIQAVQHYVGRAKAFFISRLLRDVIFREFGLAGTNRGYENARIWLQRGALVTAIVGTVGLLAVFTYGYIRGENYLKSVDAGVEEFNKREVLLTETPGPSELVNTLDAGRDLPDVYTADPPMLRFVDIVQSNKLEDQTKTAYDRVLNSHLMSHIQGRLETRIDTALEDPGNLDNVFSTYETLSTYTMLERRESFDEERFKAWVTDDWNTIYAQAPDTRASLGEHLDRLITSGIDPRNLDLALLDRARELVCRTPLPEQVYYRLYQITEAKNIKSFSLANLGAVSQKHLKDTTKSGVDNRVEGFFTRKAYDDVVLKEGIGISGRAIRDMRSECPDQQDALAQMKPQTVMRQVMQRYHAEYISAWETFLQNIRLERFSSLDDALRVLKVFSGSQSPLQRLVDTALPNTQPNVKISSTITEKLKVTIDQFGPIGNALRPFNELPVAPDGGTSPLATLIGEITELRTFVSEINEASNPPRAAFSATVARLEAGRLDAFRSLRRQSSRLPKPVGSIASDLAKHTWGAVLRNTHRYINQAWQAEVIQPYKGTIDGRYPMRATAAAEIPYADFGEFFGEDGTLETFTNKYLTPFVSLENGKPVVIDGQKIVFNKGAIDGLRRASNIRRAYFQDGGQEPKVKFSIKPTFASSNVQSMLIDLDGQKVTYRHDPQRAKNWNWPGPNGLGLARIGFDPKNKSPQYITEPGPWSWFKILDKASIAQTQEKELVVITVVGKNGVEGRYELRAASIINPFNRNELIGFKLPKAL